MPIMNRTTESAIYVMELTVRQSAYRDDDKMQIFNVL